MRGGAVGTRARGEGVDVDLNGRPSYSSACRWALIRSPSLLGTGNRRALLLMAGRLHDYGADEEQRCGKDEPMGVHGGPHQTHGLKDRQDAPKAVDAVASAPTNGNVSSPHCTQLDLSGTEYEAQ